MRTSTLTFFAILVGNLFTSLGSHATEYRPGNLVGNWAGKQVLAANIPYTDSFIEYIYISAKSIKNDTSDATIWANDEKIGEIALTKELNYYYVAIIKNKSSVRIQFDSDVTVTDIRIQTNPQPFLNLNPTSDTDQALGVMILRCLAALEKSANPTQSTSFLNILRKETLELLSDLNRFPMGATYIPQQRYDKIIDYIGYTLEQSEMIGDLKLRQVIVSSLLYAQRKFGNRFQKNSINKPAI